MRFYSILSLAIIASTASLVGCGDDSGGGAGGGASSSTSGGGGAGGSGGAGLGGAGGSGEGGAGDPTTCTKTGEFCASFILPADLQGTPAHLIVGFYESLPVMGPPFRLGVDQSGEDLKIVPGTPYPVKVTELDLMGTYTMVAVLFQPDDRFLPRPDVDWDVASDPINFDGSPLNAGNFEFAFHTADDGHTAN